MTGTRFRGGVAPGNRAYVSSTGVVNPTRTELMLRHVTVPINFANGTTEFATNFTFPATAVVFDTYVNVRTAEATGTTKTIQIGTATADSGVPNAFLDGLDVSATGMRTYINAGPVAITVGASPFAYTAVNPQVVTVTGGTTSAITLTRNGVTTANIGTTTPFHEYMSNGDVLNVTYSGAPTMKSFQSTFGAHKSVGGKRLAWVPGSNDFANLDADVVVCYYCVGDLTQPSQSNGETPELGID